MQNFSFQCDTKLIFGKDSIKNLKKEISKFANKNDKIMLIYGSGSIKRNGIYDDVKAQLQDFDIIDFSPIEPNPLFEKALEAVRIIKKENVKFLVAIGGGSVLDATKFIALASYCNNEEEMKNILQKNIMPKNALNLGCIMTLPATGSEMNPFFVISIKESDEKLVASSNLVMPKFSIIDPAYTFSLPLNQSINGIIDAFTHVMEQYATKEINTPLQDLFALSILRVLHTQGKKMLENPLDYDTRANLCLCATFGLNNIISMGVVQDWATHAIGHEITAFYGLDHAQSLAIVLPEVLKYNFECKKEKLYKLGIEVFKLEGDKNKVALHSISHIETFFKDIGMAIKLKDYGIDNISASEKISARFKYKNETIGENNMDFNDVKNILLKC